jgi:hypothetical protein
MTARRNFSGSCLGSTILAVNLVGGLMTAAAAQSPPSPSEKPPSEIPEKVAPPLEDGTNQKKLGRDNGVLRPPDNVDPGMTAKPPDTGGRMPVIPPPGSPGGDESIRPK